MKIPRNLSAPLDAQPSPIVAVVVGVSDQSKMRDVKNVVESEHETFSKTARDLSAIAGGEKRGMLSIEFGGGSKPGTSDVTWMPQSDFAQSKEGAGEDEIRYDAAIRSALETYDPATEFVLQFIAGGLPFVYVVRHAKPASPYVSGNAASA